MRKRAAGLWQSLGTWAFNATGDSVKISDTGTDGVVVADAVNMCGRGR